MMADVEAETCRS